MLKVKPDSLVAIMALIAFVILAIYLFMQDNALVGPI
jgi:hypothetical protein